MGFTAYNPGITTISKIPETVTPVIPTGTKRSARNNTFCQLSLMK
jgi:hypothetical protein